MGAEPKAATTDRETLLDEWITFRAIFERAGVPSGGIELCRHSFYAGAATLMGLMVRAAGTEARFDAIADEIRAFKYDIKRIAQ